MAFPTKAAVPPPLFENIPAALRALNQWVCWRLEPRPGEEKLTKVPYDPKDGRKASAGQPATWGTYAAAVAAYNGSQGGRAPYSGIGIELADGDGLFGGDLDGCIDPKTGNVAEWASAIIAEANTYTEYSPSGTGLRFFGLGDLPAGRRRDGPVELYDRGRFLTITGRRFGSAPAGIADCSGILPALHARLFPPKPAPAPRPQNGHTASALSLSDQDILATASRASNGAKFDALCRGDTSAYGGDDSAADLAFCSMLAFYTGPDEGRIERLFSQSALGQREKWGREDYRRRTISAALAGKSEFYTPPGAAIIQRGQRAASAVKEKAKPRSDTDRSDGAQRSESEEHPSTQDFALTDVGNGQRLAARHGADLRFCHAWVKWLIWDGQRWQKDDTGEIVRRAKETAGHIYQEAADCPDKTHQEELAKHALRSQSHARLQSMIALANSEEGIPARAAEWDKRPWLLVASNGTVDLKTGRLLESRREDMGTKLAGTKYDPEAAAPRWEAFLETVLPDADVRSYFQRAVGYALTGDVSAQCLFFLYGSGSNGKTTALRALMDTLGDYALQAAPDLLIARENGTGGPNNDVAELQGTRLVATIEVEDGKRMAEGLVKQITGGDIIKARFMRQDFFQFEPTHKIFLAANHKPIIRGQDVAIWRRIKVLPFTVQIADADKDPHLPEKLRAEVPGILAWAVRGCLDWQRQGLAEPAAVKVATAEYQTGEDVLGDFLAECCVFGPALVVTVAALYTRYIQHAEQNSERALSKKSFGARLQEGRRVYPTLNVGVNKARGWKGIGLLASEESTATDSTGDKRDTSSLKNPTDENPIESHESYRGNPSDVSLLSPPTLQDNIIHVGGGGHEVSQVSQVSRKVVGMSACARDILEFVAQFGPAEHTEIVAAMLELGHDGAAVKATITQLHQSRCIEFDGTAGGFVPAVHDR